MDNFEEMMSGFSHMLLTIILTGWLLILGFSNQLAAYQQCGHLQNHFGHL